MADLSAFEGWTQEELDVFNEVDWEAVTSVDEWKTIVRERFPGWAWALDHEELGPLLEEAAESEFTLETLQAQFRATEWFTSRSAAEREWDIFSTDPANAEELERRVEVQRGELSDLVSQLGSDLSDEALDALALDVLRRGLSEDEIIGQVIAGTKAYTAGSILAAEESIRGLAASNLITIDPDTQRSLSAKLATGEMNSDGLNSYISSVAKNQYPQFADLIDQGVSVSEYMAPQKQLIANMLGKNMQDVDFTNQYRDVLSIGDGNQVRAMSLSETERYIRSQDDYWRGKQGQDELFSVVNGLTRAMGMRR